jgi:hypothetical protein
MMRMGMALAVIDGNIFGLFLINFRISRVLKGNFWHFLWNSRHFLILFSFF